MEHEKNKNIEQENVENVETSKNACEVLDVDALSFEEAKDVLKKTLSENSETIEKLSELQSELDKTKNNCADFKDKWYRSVAEFENFKKRNQDTRQNAYYDGKKDTILSILVIGDSIERALSTELDDKTREGVNLILRQFGDTLKSLGVETIDPVGEVFDPNTCEAIHTVEASTDEQENIVKTVFKKGYKLDDKIIRYCQVVVTK